MGRGAWWATVHGVTRVRHNLATKPPIPSDGESLCLAALPGGVHFDLHWHPFGVAVRCGEGGVFYFLPIKSSCFSGLASSAG